jgi:TRAP-type C4-dicarboxylate transport system permease small subunit
MEMAQKVLPQVPIEKEIFFSELALEEIFAAIGMIVIVLSVSWGVITRYILTQPAEWTGEVAGIAFTWTVFVGAAAVFKRGEHISIDLLLAHAPRPLQVVMQLLADLIVFVTLATVAVLAIRFSIGTIDVPTTILRVPQSVSYSGAAVGFTLMALRHGIFMIRRLRTHGEQS